MTRQILILGGGAAVLIFLVRLFELKYISGDLPFKFYMAFIGIVFLAIGVYVGLRLTRERKPATPDVLPPVKGHANEFLTPRETELLTFVARGLSNREIADRLFISENTVKKHLNNIYSKLDVTRRTQAVQKAGQMGIIEA